jgi:activator of HSP90 ATPase
MSTIIKQTYEIKAPIKEVWRALTDEEIIQEWGGSPVKMDDKVGTEFEFWGGDIWGKNLEVESGKKLVQEWFGGDWKEPSKVTFVLSEKDGVTTVELTHENLPDEEVDNFDDGWKEYYMGPIKELLENKI